MVLLRADRLALPRGCREETHHHISDSVLRVSSARLYFGAQGRAGFLGRNDLPDFGSKPDRAVLVCAICET